MTTAVQTTKMTGDQIDESGRVLARAFFDDPLMMYFIPDERRRSKALPWFMSTAAKYGHKHGEVETTAGNVDTLRRKASWMATNAFLSRASTSSLFRAAG